MRTLNPEHRDKVLEIIEQSPFLTQIGVRALELGDGIYRSQLTIERTQLNSFGGVHGGVYAAMLDSACYYCAYADIPEGTGFVTLDLSVNDLRSAKLGDVLTCEAHPIKVGRTTALTEGTITDQNGNVVAHAISKLYINDKLQPMSAAVEMLGISEPMPPKFIEVD